MTSRASASVILDYLATGDGRHRALSMPAPAQLDAARLKLDSRQSHDCRCHRDGDAGDKIAMTLTSIASG